MIMGLFYARLIINKTEKTSIMHCLKEIDIF